MNKHHINFHKSRREFLLKQFDSHSIILVYGSTFKHRSYDYDYPFKQNKNFFYLTGFEEANSAILLSPAGFNIKGRKVKEILFVQPKDKLKETWTGKRLGAENVNKVLGIQHGMLNSEIYNFLTTALTPEINKLYLDIHGLYSLTGEMKNYFSPFHERLATLSPAVQIIDINYTIGKMRNIKTDFEINQMKISADICISAFEDAISQVKPGLFEYNIQSILEYNYKNYGAEDVAFDTIVASGNNACTLHYETNRDKLKNGDIVLIDSGAEFNYYNSDITRTVPVNGKFTKEQKEIYNLVLKVQKDVIRKAKPGVKLTALKKYTVDALAKGLLGLKIIKKKEEITKYYMHGVGHHLGLDTHDAVKATWDERSDFDILRPGNVITVEPGIYIPKDSDAPKKYHGIGVRIEDDILITKSGNENLTTVLVKEVNDIEKMMDN